MSELMNILDYINAEERDHPALWEIAGMDDAITGLPKYTDRYRVGKQVIVLRPIRVRLPLDLLYVGGDKDGKVIQLSYIQKIFSDDQKVVITTSGGTKVTLIYKGDHKL
jgi:hypothetical protein